MQGLSFHVLALRFPEVLAGQRASPESAAVSVSPCCLGLPAPVVTVS